MSDAIERSLTPHRPAESGWAEVALAVELFAVDPRALGGLCVRAGAGPRRDRVCGWVRELLDSQAPMLRMPTHTDEDRLLGGLALAETLRTGSVVVETGLLARSDGGVLVVPMAERLEERAVAHLCAAVDHGRLRLERDGLGEWARCRLGLLVLDEGVDGEAPLPALIDRCALLLDLSTLVPRSLPSSTPRTAVVVAARERLPRVKVEDEALAALAKVAQTAGVGGVRSLVQAAVAARCHAALEGRDRVEYEDLAVAARMVLGPRATRLPEHVEEPNDAPPTPEEDPAMDESSDPARDQENAQPDGPIGEDQAPSAIPEEVLLQAVRSGIPEGLLDRLKIESGRGRGQAGRSGAQQRSSAAGRPAGVRPGTPSPPERLAVVATLRAAAPWQRFRRKTARPSAPHVLVRPEDFRTRQHRQRTETTVIFAVDVSGSAAMQRLAEAKGAVEQVLAECYARRDHVALLALRDTDARLIVPPTRSLTRARRCLAQLAGGGATPLASGIDAARALAHDARNRGRTPLIVLMTDGRANVARDGERGGARATEDALDAAARVAEDGVSALLLDTAPRPRQRARVLAEAMRATYLPMPYLNDGDLARQVAAIRS